MILADHEIEQMIEEGRLVVEPFDPSLVQPSSLDIRLGGDFSVFRNHKQLVIDPRNDNRKMMESIVATEDEPFIIHPGEFVLGTTLEKFGFPDDICGRVEGKSSLGRLGLLVHTTAGFVDPGFIGEITLEFTNVANLPILLRPQMPIGQMCFMRMSSPVERPYGSPGLNSKYQNQRGATGSAMHDNF